MPPALWLDLDVGPFMRGLGDALTLAWLAEGLRDAETRGRGDAESRRIAFRTSGPRLELLQLFGQEVYGREVDPRESGADLGEPISVSGAYQHELDDCGRRLRIEYLAQFLGVPAVWSRPRVSASLPPRVSPSPVLLFPQTHWATRSWPACYWVDLAWQLKAAGRTVLVMLERPDERYKNVPYWLSGQPLVKLITQVASAALVIGNDSFGVHLAGTLGVPTIALCGPTNSRCVFGHFWEPAGVKREPWGTLPAGQGCGAPFSVLTSNMVCTGCHFSAIAGFRAACDQGCLSLHRLLPETVLETAFRWLAAPSTEARFSRACAVDCNAMQSHAQQLPQEVGECESGP